MTVNCNPPEPLNKFVIVGGGTAGWLAAATLSNIFKDTDTQIELVESDEIGIIGVGEATIPPFLEAIEGLGIDLIDFIQSTQASFKLGIQFQDWWKKGQSYFHPFGQLGRRIDGHEFYQCWLKVRTDGDDSPLLAHSPEAVLAEHQRFFVPFKVANTPLASTQYALHLDAGLVGQYLRRFAEARGVLRTEGKVSKVIQHTNGNIQCLQLHSGQQIAGDFYIDCSGFKGLLIEQTLNAGYVDWSQWLPCNRAVTVQTENTGDIPPYTVATAREAGWTWKIPLQHRTGNGYVFCDQFIDDQQATDTLLKAVDGKVLTEPRIIPFTTGIRRSVWKNNCLSLGLAQGFIEPLESTAIHLVSKTLAHFVRIFPDKNTSQTLIDEFNRRVYADYQEIRDFLVLHYCETQRSDTPFWQYCQTMPRPDSLQKRLAFFRASGALIPGVEELFQPTSWYAVLTGMGVYPQRYNPTLNGLDGEKLKLSLSKGMAAIKHHALQQPSHQDFIQQYCPAPKL